MNFELLRTHLKHPEYPETYPLQHPLLDAVDYALWVSIMRPFLDRIKTHHWHWSEMKYPQKMTPYGRFILPGPRATQKSGELLSTVKGHLHDWPDAAILTPSVNTPYRYAFTTLDLIEKQIVHICSLRIQDGSPVGILRGEESFMAMLVSDQNEVIPMKEPEYVDRKEVPPSIHLL